MLLCQHRADALLLNQQSLTTYGVQEVFDATINGSRARIYNRHATCETVCSSTLI